VSILATRQGDREVRLFENSGIVPPYTTWIGAMSSAGVPVTMQAALGLPTVGAAIRLISETVASLPLCVYQGEDADKRKARESDQWHLLQEEPNPDQSAFDLISDIASSVESWGNAYVRKLKVRRKIVALYVLPASNVRVFRDEGNRKVFEVFDNRGVMDRLTEIDILHVRGFTNGGGDVGLSPIQAHREFLGTALAQQRFSGRFYANDASPAGLLSVPGEVTEEVAQRTKDRWMANNGGLENSGSIAVLGNGATFQTLTIPLKDAQFIEGQEQAASVAARIFLGPAASLLGADHNLKTEEESLRFLNFCLLPRLRRIERAFYADSDLFPEMPVGEPDLYPEFHTQEFLRADAGTAAEVQHKQIQSGVLLVDEARAEMGMGPLPDGMGQVPQITPVGGAPNPNPMPATANPTPA
jgi:HK97 family phage portal protein